MTYWYDGESHSFHKDRRFWIREAVTLAQDLGLDSDMSTDSTSHHRLLKRLWWCCFMRDQFVALMTWTPPQLRGGFHNPSGLVLSDFEIGELSESLTREFGEWTIISSRDTRTQLATLCIEKAKLCQCINQILQIRYASLRLATENQMITILVPKHVSADAFEVLEYDRKLQVWYHGLPDPKTFDLRDPATSASMKASDMLTIHRAHLKLLFLSTVIALHRPQVPSRSGLLPAAYQELSRSKVWDAADEVAHLAICMRNLDMGTHRSPRGLTLFLPILLVHLQEIRPDMDYLRGTRLQKYYNCMQILHSIGDAGISDDLLSVELEAAFLKLNILPVTETKIPPPITITTLHEEAQYPANIFSFSNVTQLGTLTSSEADFLTGFISSDGSAETAFDNETDRETTLGSCESIRAQSIVSPVLSFLLQFSHS